MREIASTSQSAAFTTATPKVQAEPLTCPQQLHEVLIDTIEAVSSLLLEPLTHPLRHAAKNSYLRLVTVEKEGKDEHFNTPVEFIKAVRALYLRNVQDTHTHWPTPSPPLGIINRIWGLKPCPNRESMNEKIGTILNDNRIPDTFENRLIFATNHAMSELCEGNHDNTRIIIKQRANTAVNKMKQYISPEFAHKFQKTYATILAKQDTEFSPYHYYQALVACGIQTLCHLKLIWDNEKGVSVIAGEDIPEGTYLGSYFGKSSYLSQVKKGDVYIMHDPSNNEQTGTSAQDYGGISRFYNNSNNSSPNLKKVCVLYDGRLMSVFYAATEIQKGTELTFKYNL